MFPDPTLRWMPFPSIIDGIAVHPFVKDQGSCRGVLHLAVISDASQRFYGVEFRTLAHLAIDEFIYSVAGQGDDVGCYDGGVYIKEASRSALLDTYARFRPQERARHFSLVGNDYCFEVLTLHEPVVLAFATKEDAYQWGPAGAH